MAKTITQRVIDNARNRGVTIYTRRQWGSLLIPVYLWRRKYRKHSLLPGKPVDTIWQHITVTYDTGKGRVSFKKDMRTLERIGDDRFGTGVSYNWAVDAVTGEVGQGQSLDAAGAHTLNDKKIPGYSENQNYVSLAIAIIGMVGTKLSERAGNAIVQLIKAHIDEGAVTENFDYNPHSMVAYKSCPTENITEVMPSLRRAVAKPDFTEPRLVFNVGSFNIGPGDISKKKESEDLEFIAGEDLDFFGLQEVGPARRREFEDAHDELAVVETIVFNRERWKHLHHGQIELSPPTNVGFVPGRRTNLPANKMDWLHIEHRVTKKTIWVANAHLVVPDSPRRKRLQRKQIDSIADWLAMHKNDETFLTADFNHDHRKWQTAAFWKPFTSLGFSPNWRLGFVSPSFAHKYIDGIWSNERARKHWVLELNSDHKGIRAKYAFRI